MFTLLFPPIPCVHCQLHSRPIFIGPALAHGPAPRNQRSYLEHLGAQIGTAGLSIARVLSSPRRFRYGGRFGGGGERGQFRTETSPGPGRPPARPAPRSHPLLTKINVPPSLSQSPGSAGRNTPRVLSVPPETPAPRGTEGQQPSLCTAAVSRGREAPARRPARHREVASRPLLRRCSVRAEAGGRARFGG